MSDELPESKSSGGGPSMANLRAELSAARAARDEARRANTAVHAEWAKGDALLTETQAALSQAREETERCKAERDAAHDLLFNFLDLPNDIRYTMGPGPGSTRLDEAYIKGWNDLRVKIGREMSELVDAILSRPSGASGGESGDGETHVD